MSMAACLLALIALGADAPPPAPAHLSYQVRFVEVQGLAWRAEARPFLTRVARQGGATVWTAPKAALGPIGGQVVAAPAVSGGSGQLLSVSHLTRKSYVADVERFADGPVGRATAVSFRPEIDWVEDGVTIGLRGRRIDQGVLAELSLSETRVDAIHRYHVGEETFTGTDESGEGGTIRATVQAPEVSTNRVAGEWLIPRDGLLIVSLGARSRSGEGLFDRLAIIEAAASEAALPSPSSPPLPIGPSTLSSAPRPILPPAPARPPGVMPPLPAPDMLALAAAPAATPAPAVMPPIGARSMPLPPPVLPSRTLPTPRNAQGEVVALPPLPEVEGFDEPDPSSEPRPSPQAPHHLANPSTKSSFSSIVSDVTDPKPGRFRIGLAETTFSGLNPAGATARTCDASGVPSRRIEVELDGGRICLGAAFATTPKAKAGDAVPAPPGCCVAEANRPEARPTRQFSLSLSFRRSVPKADLPVPPAVAATDKTPSCEDAVGCKLMDQVAAGLANYARSGEESEGPVRILEVDGRDDEGQPVKLAVSIEANAAGRKMLLGSISLAPEAHAEVGCCDAESPKARKIVMCPQAEAAVAELPELPDLPDAAPASPAEPKRAEAPKSDPIVRPAKDDSAAREVWPLTLPEAFRIALENSEVYRVAAIGSGAVPSPIVVSRLRADIPEASFKNHLMNLVRSVEQSYWTLSQAQIQFWAAETAVELGEEIVRREKAWPSVGRGSIPDVVEAEEQLERLRLDFVQRTSDLITAERRFRNLLGLPPADDRRIVTASAPSEEEAELDWESSRAEMLATHPDLAGARGQLIGAVRGFIGYSLLPGSPVSTLKTRDLLASQAELCEQVAHEMTHQLARFFLEVEAGYKSFQTARRLRTAALQRLEAQKQFFEEGKITIDRYLDAVNRWANAVTQEAQFQAQYNMALASLEVARGTLLARKGIEVVEKAAPKRDEALAKTTYEAAGPRFRLQFGISPVPMAPVVSADPFLIRLPVGYFGMIQCSGIHAFTQSIGLFW